MASSHAVAPPSPVEVTITAVLGVYRHHQRGAVFAGSLLLGAGIAADVIMGSILLHQEHRHGAEMLLLLGSFAVAAALGAWAFCDHVKPVSNWDGKQWGDAGKVEAMPRRAEQLSCPWCGCYVTKLTVRVYGAPGRDTVTIVDSSGIEVCGGCAPAVIQRALDEQDPGRPLMRVESCEVT